MADFFAEDFSSQRRGGNSDLDAQFEIGVALLSYFLFCYSLFIISKRCLQDSFPRSGAEEIQIWMLNSR